MCGGMSAQLLLLAVVETKSNMHNKGILHHRREPKHETLGEKMKERG